jgi:hypothetical protein
MHNVSNFVATYNTSNFIKIPNECVSNTYQWVDEINFKY